MQFSIMLRTPRRLGSFVTQVTNTRQSVVIELMTVAVVCETGLLIIAFYEMSYCYYKKENEIK